MPDTITIRWPHRRVSKKITYHLRKILILKKFKNSRRYLARFSEEIETIKLKQSISKNRVNQHANRLSILEMNIEREKGEFNGAGIGMNESMAHWKRKETNLAC